MRDRGTIYLADVNFLPTNPPGKLFNFEAILRSGEQAAGADGSDFFDLCPGPRFWKFMSTDVVLGLSRPYAELDSFGSFASTWTRTFLGFA